MKTALQEKQEQELERLLAELPQELPSFEAYVLGLRPSLAIRKLESVLRLLRTRYSFPGARRSGRRPGRPARLSVGSPADNSGRTS